MRKFGSNAFFQLLSVSAILGVGAWSAAQDDVSNPAEPEPAAIAEAGDESTNEPEADESKTGDDAASETAGDASEESGEETADAEDAADAADGEEESLEQTAASAGVDAFLAGDVDRAYRIFQRAYEADDDSNPPGILVAFLYSEKRKFVEMRRALERTAEDYPNDPEAFLQLASIDLREGRYLETALLLERVEKTLADYASKHVVSERLAVMREEALDVRANLAERKGRFDEAAEATQKIVDANPTNAGARWNLGYLGVKRDKLDEAEKAFDEAAKLNPELFSGWLQVASELDRADRSDEAKAFVESKKDARDKASKRERAFLARLYMRWDMLEEATELVDSLENSGDASDFDRWATLGTLALYANQYGLAEEYFGKAVVVDGNSFEATNGLALALLDQGSKGKLEQAKTIAEKNYRAAPNSPEAAATYAWTLFLSGDAKGADAIFGPMLQSGEATATAAYYLAEIANLREDQALALNLLDLALSQKTNFPKRAAARELRAMILGEDAGNGESKDEPSGKSNGESKEAAEGESNAAPAESAKPDESAESAAPAEPRAESTDAPQPESQPAPIDADSNK